MSCQIAKESVVKPIFQQTVGHFETIMTQVRTYFDGIHYGDTTALRTIFHQDAILKAPGLRRTLQEWFDAIETRPIPAEQGAAYDYNVMSIEIIGNQAMAKVYCPLFGHEYVDYLGFLLEEGQWLIVNKMYADRG